MKKNTEHRDERSVCENTEHRDERSSVKIGKNSSLFQLYAGQVTKKCVAVVHQVKPAVKEK